jgi:shikimate kinase
MTYGSPVTPIPSLVLLGAPGAGKSTVGALLAERLGVELLDTDDLLAARVGTDVGEFFLDVGEERFREVEAEVAAAALGRPGVVALGGGAVPGVAQRLEAYRADGGTVVFLDVSLAAAMPRVGLNAPRAVVVGSPRAQYATMANARRPVYAAAADAVVDTSSLSPTEVAEAVLAVLRG